MVRGFEGIVEYLTERVALVPRATFSDIRNFLIDYHCNLAALNKRRNHEPQNGSLAITEKSSQATSTQNGNVRLASDAGATNNQDDELVSPSNSLQVIHVESKNPARAVTDGFVEKVWQMIVCLPNFILENDNKPQKLPKSKASRPKQTETTSQNQDLYQSSDTAGKSSYVGAPDDIASKQIGVQLEEQNGPNAVANSREEAIEYKYRGLALQATEHQIWKTLAGHDVDFKKIPPSEFDLLSIIAGSGENGILQPDLIHKSGQDKRSLPKRTDALHNKGYVVKEPVVANGRQTSLLTWRIKRKKPQKISPLSIDKLTPSEIHSRIHRDNGVFSMRDFFTIAIQIIKKADLITVSDIQKKMGLHGLSKELRIANRYFHKMEVVGCIRRLSANTTDEWLESQRTLKFVKDPREKDLKAFLKFACSDAQEIWRNNQKGDTNPEPAKRTPIGPPAWDPHRPLNNIIYDVVKAAGPQGISTMDVAKKVIGPFGHRSVEQALFNMTDVWQESQPPHLRHLAIVRDTRSAGRVLHYVFRTYDNFQLAVEAGEASWEPINEAYNNLCKEASVPPAPQEELLDEWGFPVIPQERFANPEGDASASKSLNVFMKGDAEILKTWRNPKAKSIALPRRLQKTVEESFSDVSHTAPARRGAYNRRSDSSSNPVAVNQPRTKAEKDFFARTKKQAIQIALKETDRDTNSSEGVPQNIAEPVKNTSSMRRVTSEQDVLENENESGPPTVPTPEITINTPLADEQIQEINSHESNEAALANVKKAIEPVDPGVDDLAKSTSDMAVSGKKQKAPDQANDKAQQGPKKKQKKNTAPQSETIQLDSETQKRVNEIHMDLLNIKRPGVYINPPQRLPQTRGRPRKRLMMVIKTDGLKELLFVKDLLENIPGQTVAGQPKDDPKKREPAAVNEASKTLSPKPRNESMGLNSTEGDVIAQSNHVPSEVMPSNLPVSQVDEYQPNAERASIQDDIQNREGKDSTRLSNTRKKHVIASTETRKSMEATTIDSPAQVTRTRENSIDSEIVNVEEQDGPLQPTTESPPKKKKNYKPRRGVGLHGGTVQFKRTQSIIGIITDAGGAYPGGRAIWFPFVTRLQKADPNARTEVETVKRAVENLVKTDKLKRYKFTFRNDKGSLVDQDVICLPSVDINDTIVQETQRGMRRNHPKAYFPDTVEVDPNLKVNHDAAWKSRDLPPRRNGFVFDNTVTVQREYAKRDNPAWRKWTVEGNSELQNPNSTATPSAQGGNDDQNEVLSRLKSQLDYNRAQHYQRQSRVSVSKKENKESHVQSGKRKETSTEKIQGDKKRRRKERPFNIIFDSHTEAAELDERLREQQQAASPTTQHGTAVIINPLSWVLAVEPYDKFRTTANSGLASDLGGQRCSHSKLRRCITLTDPRQLFNPTSGTFSTEFNVVRDPRPKPKVNPNLQNEFESKLHQSLNSVIGNNFGQERSQTRSFNHYIEAMETWEKQNSQLLSSSSSLMQPRFINHTISQPELQKFYQPIASAPVKKGPKRKQPDNVAQNVPPTKRQNRQKQPVQRVDRDIVQQPKDKKTTKDSSEAKDNTHTPPLVSLDTACSIIKSDHLRVNCTPNFDYSPTETIRAKHDSTEALFANPSIQYFAVTVCVVRSLLGSNAFHINWSLVNILFPKDSKEQLKNVWKRLKNLGQKRLSRIAVAFHQAYLAACQQEEIIPIVYSQWQFYSWGCLVEWAVKQTNHAYFPPPKPKEQDVIELPSKRKAFENEFESKIMKKKRKIKKKSDFYHTPKLMRQVKNQRKSHARPIPPSEYSRSDRSIRLSCMQPQNAHKQISEAAHEFDVARSLVRANAFTPEGTYDGISASDRLEQYEDKTLDDCFSSLRKTYVLGREPKNLAKKIQKRGIAVPKNFFEAFKKPWHPETFHNAFQYKLRLDSLFMKYKTSDENAPYGEGLIEIPTMEIEKEMIMLLINFTERGWVKLCPDYGKFGQQTAGCHKLSGLMPPDQARCLMVPHIFVKPLPDYPWGVPDQAKNLPLPPAPHLHPNASLMEQKIPIFYDIHDRVLNDMWQTTLAIILEVMSSHGGANIAEVMRKAQGRLEPWDVELAMQWLIEIGVVSELAGSIDSSDAVAGSVSSASLTPCHHPEQANTSTRNDSFSLDPYNSRFFLNSAESWWWPFIFGDGSGLKEANGYWKHCVRMRGLNGYRTSYRPHRRGGIASASGGGGRTVSTGSNTHTNSKPSRQSIFDYDWSPPTRSTAFGRTIPQIMITPPSEQQASEGRTLLPPQVTTFLNPPLRMRNKRRRIIDTKKKRKKGKKDKDGTKTGRVEKSSTRPALNLPRGSHGARTTYPRVRSARGGRIITQGVQPNFGRGAAGSTYGQFIPKHGDPRRGLGRFAIPKVKKKKLTSWDWNAVHDMAPGKSRRFNAEMKMKRKRGECMEGYDIKGNPLKGTKDYVKLKKWEKKMRFLERKKNGYTSEDERERDRRIAEKRKKRKEERKKQRREEKKKALKEEKRALKKKQRKEEKSARRGKKRAPEEKSSTDRVSKEGRIASEKGKEIAS